MSTRKQTLRDQRELTHRFADQIGDRLTSARGKLEAEAGEAAASHVAEGTFHSSQRTADEANLLRRELRRRGAIILEAWKRTLAAESVERRGPFVAYATADATRRIALERVDITTFCDRRIGASAGVGYLYDVERGMVSELTAELRQLGRSDLHHTWATIWESATGTFRGRVIVGTVLLGSLLLGRACGLY